jgi:hypothetical protein
MTAYKSVYEQLEYIWQPRTREIDPKSWPASWTASSPHTTFQQTTRRNIYMKTLRSERSKILEVYVCVHEDPVAQPAARRAPDYLISRCRVIRLRFLLYFLSSKRADVFFRFCTCSTGMLYIRWTILYTVAGVCKMLQAILSVTKELYVTGTAGQAQTSFQRIIYCYTNLLGDIT